MGRRGFFGLVAGGFAAALIPAWRRPRMWRWDGEDRGFTELRFEGKLLKLDQYTPIAYWADRDHPVIQLQEVK